MKLVLFKISGEYDYGALSFEQEGPPLQECYNQMLEDKAQILEDDDEESNWTLSIEKEFLVRDQEEANKIVEALNLVSAEDWLGDYDSMKNTNWLYLIVN